MANSIRINGVGLEGRRGPSIVEALNEILGISDADNFEFRAVSSSSTDKHNENFAFVVFKSSSAVDRALDILRAGCEIFPGVHISAENKNGSRVSGLSPSFGPVSTAELYHWEYYDPDRFSWTRFNVAVSTAIESFFLSRGTSGANVAQRDKIVFIDFSSMTYFEPPAVPVRRTSNKAQPDIVYEWETDESWAAYDTGSCEMIRLALSAERASISLHVKISGAITRISLDLNRMEQRNSRTRHPRQFRVQVTPERSRRSHRELELIYQYVAIMGATEADAESQLEQANWNIADAIELAPGLGSPITPPFLGRVEPLRAPTTRPRHQIDLIAQFVAIMNVSEADAAEALKNSHWDVDAAIQRTFREVSGAWGPPSPPPPIHFDEDDGPWHVESDGTGNGGSDFGFGAGSDDDDDSPVVPSAGTAMVKQLSQSSTDVMEAFQVLYGTGSTDLLVQTLHSIRQLKSTGQITQEEATQLKVDLVQRGDRVAVERTIAAYRRRERRSPIGTNSTTTIPDHIFKVPETSNSASIMSDSMTHLVGDDISPRSQARILRAEQESEYELSVQQELKARAVKDQAERQAAAIAEQRHRMLELGRLYRLHMYHDLHSRLAPCLQGGVKGCVRIKFVINASDSVTAPSKSVVAHLDPDSPTHVLVDIVTMVLLEPWARSQEGVEVSSTHVETLDHILARAQQLHVDTVTLRGLAFGINVSHTQFKVAVVGSLIVLGVDGMAVPDVPAPEGSELDMGEAVTVALKAGGLGSVEGITGSTDSRGGLSSSASPQHRQGDWYGGHTLREVGLGGGGIVVVEAAEDFYSEDINREKGEKDDDV